MNKPIDKIKKEFLEDRTSWKYYMAYKMKAPNISIVENLLLEILKELQFMNDKK